MRVLVFGTGAIGGYVGGALLKAGLEVTFFGRPSVKKRFDEHGLTLTDYDGGNHHLEAPLPFQTQLKKCEPAEVVLLTVKCTGVAEAARQLADWITPETQVICLQNGVGSKKTAAEFLPAQQLSSGMVPFNVASMDEGRLHRGTEGALLLEQSPCSRELVAAWQKVGLPADQAGDFEAISWAKLQLNLNNAINALAGVPLVEELSQRGYRRVLAACQWELLAALRAAGIKPARLTPLPAFLIPWILCLPNWLFKLIARRMLAIDPLARSSMWDDLEQRRKTEIDFLNGAVVELAHAHELPAPVNRDIRLLIREAEAKAEGSPQIAAVELADRLL